MVDVKSICRETVLVAINKFISENYSDISAVESSSFQIQTPPYSSMGDLGIPMFVFAKALRMGPPQIAAKVVQYIDNNSIGEFIAVGPYINVKLKKGNVSFEILQKIENQKESYGSFNSEEKKPLEGRRVMVEFSSPNTNKPLHLGHMRNDALGESVSRILKMAGAEVFKVDLINNRGIHICKSMLAYKLFHESKGETPESLGMKGDHFVGQCYVEFDKYTLG